MTEQAEFRATGRWVEVVSRIEASAHHDVVKIAVELRAELRNAFVECEQQAATMSASALQVEAWIAEGAAAVKQVMLCENVISTQAGELARLRAEVTLAREKLAVPVLVSGLRRCEGDAGGVDLLLDYDVINADDSDGGEAVAVLVSVWHGRDDLLTMLEPDVLDALELACQEALDDWCADERDEFAERARELVEAA